MKSTLTLLLMLCVCFSAQAQWPENVITVEKTKPTGMFLHHDTPTNHVRQVRELENFTLQDNQYIVGNSDSDEYYNTGYSGQGKKVEVGAIIYPGYYKRLQNPKALGIRFCLGDDTPMYQVMLMDEQLEHSAPLAVKEIKEGKKGWNYVPFDAPVPLPKNGLMMTYTYEELPDKAPLCNWPDKAFGGFYCIMPKEPGFSGSDPYSWYDFSGYEGALCIQLIVEADPLPDYDLQPTDVLPIPSAQGEEGAAYFYCVSNSAKEINSFEYKLMWGKNEMTDKLTLRTPIEPGLNKENYYPIKIPAMQKYGRFNFKVTVTKVNDQPVENVDTIKFTQDVYSRRVSRVTCVEEMTGTGCGYCPRGWAGMEYIRNTYPREGFVVAVHQYNGDDPMYNTNYAKLAFGGAPSCMIDRKTGHVDPYYGIYQEGIDSDFERYNSIVPAVAIDLKGSFTPDMKHINCEADVEFLTKDAREFTIAYVLTADGIDGQKYRWPQENYYTNDNPEGSLVLAQIPELGDFCMGGEKGSKKVGLVFNDVMIGSSYNGDGRNQTASLGTNHEGAEVIHSTYKLQMTCKDELLQALDYDKMHLCAMVLDPEGKVANAARIKLVNPNTEDGISEVEQQTPTDSRIYDLSGRMVTKPQHGVYIIGGKKVLR